MMPVTRTVYLRTKLVQWPIDKFYFKITKKLVLLTEKQSLDS